MIDTTGQPNQLAAHLVRMQRSAAAKWQLNPIPALPFCHVRLSGPKPQQKSYPKALKTLGDHLRKRRLDLGLLQKDVADQLGVDTASIGNWESNETQPMVHCLPAILAFLGDNPLPEADDLIGKLKRLRGTLGSPKSSWLRNSESTNRPSRAGSGVRPNRLVPTENCSKISLREMASSRSARDLPQPEVSFPPGRLSRSGRSLA
jgi:transcriptional regulator with XRE-family HTH domain